MCASKLGRNRTEDAKLKITTAGNSQSYSVLVTNNTDKLNSRNLYLYEKHLYLLVYIIFILQNV